MIQIKNVYDKYTLSYHLSTYSSKTSLGVFRLKNSSQKSSG